MYVNPLARNISDGDLEAAYERTAADPDSETAPLLLAEMKHRGIAE